MQLAAGYVICCCQWSVLRNKSQLPMTFNCVREVLLLQSVHISRLL